VTAHPEHPEFEIEPNHLLLVFYGGGYYYGGPAVGSRCWLYPLLARGPASLVRTSTGQARIVADAVCYLRPLTLGPA
jgi:hypothetical protein